MGEPTATEIHKLEQMAEDLLRRASSQAERDALAEAKRGIHGWKSEVAAGRSGASFQKLAQEWIFKAGEARRAAAKGGIPSMGKPPTAEEVHEAVHAPTEEELREIENQPNPSDVQREAKRMRQAQADRGQRVMPMDEAVIAAKLALQERASRAPLHPLFDIAPKRELAQGAQDDLSAIITDAERVSNPSPDVRSRLARAKMARADLSGTLDVAVAPEDIAALEHATGEARRAADDLLKVLPASVRTSITGAGLGVIRDGKTLLLDVQTRASLAKGKLPKSMEAPLARLNAALTSVEKTAAVMAGSPAGKIRTSAAEKLAEDLREVGNATAALQDARDLEIAAGRLPHVEVATVRTSPLPALEPTREDKRARLLKIDDSLRSALPTLKPGQAAAMENELHMGEQAIEKGLLDVAEMHYGRANSILLGHIPQPDWVPNAMVWARFKNWVYAHPRLALTVAAGGGVIGMLWGALHFYLQWQFNTGAQTLFEAMKNNGYTLGFPPNVEAYLIDTELTGATDAEFKKAIEGMNERIAVENLAIAGDKVAAEKMGVMGTVRDSHEIYRKVAEVQVKSAEEQRDRAIRRREINRVDSGPESTSEDATSLEDKVQAARKSLGLK